MHTKRLTSTLRAARRLEPAARLVATGEVADRAAGGYRWRRLFDRQRLAGENRLVTGQSCRVDDADVGRHDVTEPQQHHVAGNDVDDVDPHGRVVTQRGRLPTHLVVQQVSGAFGTVWSSTPAARGLRRDAPGQRSRVRPDGLMAETRGPSTLSVRFNVGRH